MCSIDGDLWVFDPTAAFGEPGNLIAITDFVKTPPPDMNTDVELYEPKWVVPLSGTPYLVFVVRWPGSPALTAYSDIYIINDIFTVIDDIRNLTAAPIDSWTDYRVKELTGSPFENNRSIWGPSGSPDGTMISYCKDYNNMFSNVSFVTDPGNTLKNCDFDSYKYEPDIGYWLAGNPPKYTVRNEAFVKWAPSGGDKFVFIDNDQGSGNYKVSIFLDPTIYGFDGTSPSRGINYKFSKGFFTLSDHCYTSITLTEGYASTLGTISILPLVNPPSGTNTNLTSIGEYRTFLAGGIDRELDEEAEIKMHYVGAAIPKKESEKDLNVYRYNKTKNTWELIPCTVIEDEDGNPGNDTTDGGFVVFKTKKLGTFGLFFTGELKDKSGEDGKEYRIYPNPFKPSVAGFGDSETGIVFDRLPNDVEEINIYSIAGDLICSIDDENLIYYKNYTELTLPYGNTYTSTTGSVAVWNVKNEKGTRVASGIYMVLFKTSSGKDEFRKVAVIW